MEKHYKRIAKWGTIIGALFMVVGFVSLISFVLNVAGLIEQDLPGGILFIFGLILYPLGKEAESYLKEPKDETKDQMIKHMSEMVMWFTTLSLITIVVVIVGIAVFFLL